LSKELADLEKKLKKRIKEIEAKQEAVDGIEDRVFSSFCEEMGLANIREYESKELQLFQKYEVSG